MIFKSFGVNKINELVATGDKLENNVASPVKSGLGPNLARGPQAVHEYI
jgi:hypothetical protein